MSAFPGGLALYLRLSAFAFGTESVGSGRTAADAGLALGVGFRCAHDLAGDLVGFLFVAVAWVADLEAGLEGKGLGPGGYPGCR